MEKRGIVLFGIIIFLISKYELGDIVETITYLGGLILPSNPKAGFFILIALMLLLVFWNNIANLYSRIKLKNSF